MTAIPGFDKPLYILSFDDRDAISSMSGSEDMLTEEHAAQIASARSQLAFAKHVVFDAFEDALAAGVPKDKASILVDEEFGADILGNATVKGYLTACPVEKSVEKEFDFEYGEDFAKHIAAMKPTFCKVLVRYNPEGDEDLNRRQAARLKRLSEFLHSESQSLFLLELLLAPESAQLKRVNGDKHAYNREVRPGLMIEAIRQLRAAQVDPDVWGVEGLYRSGDCENVVAAARSGGRDNVGCIILGAGKNEEKVRERLKTAAAAPGFIGFAVGRTIFSEPLGRWAAGENTAKGAATQIGRRFSEFVNIFESARTSVAGI